MDGDALDRLAGLPGVQPAIEAARDACTTLRWHPALRRLMPQAGAEAEVRAARSSAALAGARLPVGLVRDAVRGARPYPDDAVGRTVHGAVRALAEVDRLGDTWQRAPMQALARLHVASSAGLVPDDALGRPRLPGEEAGDETVLRSGGVLLPAPVGPALAGRLAELVALLTASPSSPALLVAALAHAEVMTARPFVAGNGVVARALCRTVLIGRGLDPTGVAVWESALLAAGPGYPASLVDYAVGGADGVRGWLITFARAVVDGAAEGFAVCDDVLAGHPRA